MIRSIIQFDCNVHDLIAGQRAVLHGFADTFIDLADVFFRNRSADDGVLEFITFAWFTGLDSDLDMAILPTAA